MAPIIFYHKALVHWFSWLFSLLLVALIFFKFLVNYRHIRSSLKERLTALDVLKKTFLTTAAQIMQKTFRFIVYAVFLAVVFSVTILGIWFNNRWMKIH